MGILDGLRDVFAPGPIAPEPMARLGFGPNRVKIQIARAMRDDSGKCLRDKEGNVLYHDEIEEYENENVTCSMGLEAAKAHLFNTAGAIAKYIVLSESNDAPDAAHTVVADEITVSGLARAAATYSGNGTGVCSLAKQFTATGSFSTVQLMGLLDAATTGNLYFEATFTSCALESGDTITASWDTITLS